MEVYAAGMWLNTTKTSPVRVKDIIQGDVVPKALSKFREDFVTFPELVQKELNELLEHFRIYDILHAITDSRGSYVR